MYIFARQKYLFKRHRLIFHSLVLSWVSTGLEILIAVMICSDDCLWIQKQTENKCSTVVQTVSSNTFSSDSIQHDSCLYSYVKMITRNLSCAISCVISHKPQAL